MLTLRGLVLGFDLEDSDSLSRLVTECGYSKPTKDSPLAEKFDKGEGISYSAQRLGSKVRFAAMLPDEDALIGAIHTILFDLKTIGLIK